MKKLFVFLCALIFTLSIFAQNPNRAPGPLKVIRGAKSITLDVTDTTMVDLNNRVKLMQKGDTLVILSRNHVLAKISLSKVWFAGTGLSANVGDTIEFSDGSQIRSGGSNHIIEFFPYNSAGDYAYLYRDNGHYSTFNISRLYLNVTDTTLNRYTGQIAFNGHKFFGYADGRWINFAGGGTGTVAGTISRGQVASGNGSNTLTGDNKFMFYAGTVKILHSDSDTGLYVTNTSGIGVRVNNTGGGQGIYVTKTSSGEAAYFYATAPSTGDVVRINNQGTGNSLVANYGANFIVTIKDSLWCHYAHTSNKTRFAGFSHKGALYADSTSASGFALLMDIPSAIKELANTVNGEIAWYFTDVNGNVKQTHRMDTLSLGKQIQTIVARGEINLRHNAELEVKISHLELGIYILFAMVIILGITVFIVIVKK